MKKQFSVLFFSFLASQSLWATEPRMKLVTPAAVELQLAHWNTWLMCELPEIWNADNADEILNELAQSDAPEKRTLFARYIEADYAIQASYYSDEEHYDELLSGGALLNKYNAIVNRLSDTQRNATLVENCNEDWGAKLQTKRKQLGYQD